MYYIKIIVLFLSYTLTPLSWASGSYNDLVELFGNFRVDSVAPMRGGVPDYAKEAMAEHLIMVSRYQARLKQIDSSAWPVDQQVDYHLVRAEMNAHEFFHKVHRPWARDPGFYSMLAGDAGASIDAPAFFAPVKEIIDAARSGSLQVSLNARERQVLATTLSSIPQLYQSARANLTAPAADLADLALRNLPREREIYLTVVSLLKDNHADLAGTAMAAAEAVTSYISWIREYRDEMAPVAGLGRDNYSWWLRNVQLFPWDYQQSNRVIMTEYDRVITFLKFEEHRNRQLPPLDVAMTAGDWNARLKHALEYVVEFLRDKEIMTIDEWVDPMDYYRKEARLESTRGEADVELLPENSSIDTKVRQREILPGETHEYIGHMLDDQRKTQLDLSPIRRADPKFNMEKMRLEGWAVALEELLMQAGVLDERPRRGREMQYLMNASHFSLSIPDMKLQAAEINLTEARRMCADMMPRGWSRPHEDMVWFEMQSNLRNPGGFHSQVVLGKAYFMKMMREQAQTLDENFVLRDFIDSFLASGNIPLSLIRWEITGDSSDVPMSPEPL